ncbi:MAG: hypothetical protein R2698_06775 [Microthrixaceae bacterium]
MNVVLVSTAPEALPAPDADLPLLTAAFARIGVACTVAAWRDRSVDWAAFDLAVIRSPWDYCDHLTEFDAWLDHIEHVAPGRLHNPAGLLRWNLDKGYLADLQNMGVPVVPTRYADTPAEVRAALTWVAEKGAAEVVVKPRVSAGSRDTGRFDPSDRGASELGTAILRRGGSVMVQPAVTSVATAGEIAWILLDGAHSHQVRKGPILASGGGLIGGGYSEIITPCHGAARDTAGNDVAAAAVRAAEHVAHRRGWLPTGRHLLYARIDVVFLDDGEPAVLEAELFEPSLFLATSEGAARRFVDACLRRAETSPGVNRRR